MPQSAGTAPKATNPASQPPTPKVDVQIQPQSTKRKGRAAQKFLNKCFSKNAKTEKPKTERGEQRPPRRTHHCAFCHQPFNHTCKEKNHMVPCRIHPTIYRIPGKECHTCTVEAEAEARNNKETDERDGSTQKAKQDAFFVGDKARKKPGVKAGRLSFDNGTYRVS